jgi:LssY C-terminus
VEGWLRRSSDSLLTPRGSTTSVLAVAWFLACGCARYHPAPVASSVLRDAAVTQEHDGFRVSVMVPDDAEVERLFGVPLAKYGVQPVGVVITNNTQDLYWVSRFAIDPDYFTPIEAANRARYFFAKSANEEMRLHFLASEIRSTVGPGQQISGFVFTNLSRGLKPVNVNLIRVIQPGRLVPFYFLIRLTNLHADYVGPEKLDSLGAIRDVSEDELRSAIEAMPCCATTENGRGVEDPLNFVVVGQADVVFASFARMGWHISEVLRTRSALETLRSYFLSDQYSYAPVSPIYLFGRHQDVALEKTRATARQRNHLRVWQTPLRCAGKPVWIGQVSRDVGLTFSWQTVIGHQVDPDVDEDRDYLVEEMSHSQGLERIGWVKGVGAAPPSAPRHMEDGSPFFTDGLRLVLWFADPPIALDEIQFLPWERLQPD